MTEHPFITLYCGSCGTPSVFPVPCGLRLCPFCRSAKFGRLYSSYYSKINQIPFHRLSHITLTIPNFRYLTPTKVKQFTSNFIKLKRSKFFQKYVKGGIAVIECKHVSDEKGWNLHLHMLVDASFLPHKELSSSWRSITGDSFIVDVRRVKDVKKDLGHLLKYFLKVPTIQGSDQELLKLNYENAFSRVRTVVSFGSLYGKITKKDFDYKCPKCGNETFITEYRLGELSRLCHDFVNRGSP